MWASLWQWVLNPCCVVGIMRLGKILWNHSAKCYRVSFYSYKRLHKLDISYSTDLLYNLNVRKKRKEDGSPPGHMRHEKYITDTYWIPNKHYDRYSQHYNKETFLLKKINLITTNILTYSSICWFMKTTKGASVLFFKNRYATNLSASLIKDNESVGSSRNRIMQLLYTCTRAIPSECGFLKD